MEGNGMSSWLVGILAFTGGTWFGVFIMSLMAASRRGDR